MLVRFFIGFSVSEWCMLWLIMLVVNVSIMLCFCYSVRFRLVVGLCSWLCSWLLVLGVRLVNVWLSFSVFIVCGVWKLSDGLWLIGICVVVLVSGMYCVLVVIIVCVGICSFYEFIGVLLRWKYGC